jgi:hypothetical protein
MSVPAAAGLSWHLVHQVWCALTPVGATKVEGAAMT